MNIISKTLIISALYTLNKEAKKLRDEREAVKVKLFESYEDEYGAEWAGIKNAIADFNFCGEDGCTNSISACEYCSEEYSKLETEQSALYERMNELKWDISELYTLKESILPKVLTPSEIHEFADSYRLFYKYGIYSFHSDLIDPDDYELPVTTKIDHEISSDLDSSKQLFSQKFAINLLKNI